MRPWLIAGRAGSGVLSGPSAEVLQDASWLDPAGPRPLEHFRDLIGAHLPAILARALAKAPESWAAFARYQDAREGGGEPEADAAASILEEVDRLCRKRSEDDLGDPWVRPYSPEPSRRRIARGSRTGRSRPPASTSASPASPP